MTALGDTAGGVGGGEGGGEGGFGIARAGGVATITASLGAAGTLSVAALGSLRAIAEALADDAGVRAVVLRTQGANFGLGMDLRAMPDHRRDGMATVQLRRAAGLGRSLLRAIRDIPQPTICVVHGIATGAATCIASACDFRIAAPSARVGYGEVRLGLNLMWNALPLAIQAVGLARAKRMVMTGALFDAATLLEWGFFDRLVPEDEAGRDAAALAMAEEFAALPPVAVQMIKQSANAWAGALDQAVMHADTDQWLLASRTADHAEAREAFFAKRRARFTGD